MGAPQYEQAGADVAGSGTPGTIPVWSSGTTLGNSIVTQTAQGVVVTGFTNGLLPTSGSTPTNASFLVRGPLTNALFMGASSASPFGTWLQSTDAAVLGNWYPLLLNPNGGNVGIGTASPVSFAGYTSLTLNNATNGGMVAVQQGGVSRGFFYANGADPFIEASGASANLVFVTNGAQRMRIDTTGQLFRWNTFTDSSNYKGTRLSSATYSGAEYSTLTVVGIGTFAASNIGLVLQPLGTGAITAQMPDGTATGGNARGNYSTDLQLQRSAAAQVAAGANSFAAGSENTITAAGAGSFAAGNNCTVSGLRAMAVGDTCTASGTSSVSLGKSNIASGANSSAIGQSNTASGVQSVALGASTSSGGQAAVAAGYDSRTTSGAFAGLATGHNAIASLRAQRAHSSGQFAAFGDAQMSRLIARNSTTDATKTTLFLNGTSERLVLPASTTWAATIYVTGRSAGGTDNAFYIRQCVIKRDGANNTALVGTVQTIGTDIESNAAWDVEVTADDTNEALQIAVTGAAATTIRWVARVELVEVGLA